MGFGVLWTEGRGKGLWIERVFFTFLFICVCVGMSFLRLGVMRQSGGGAVPRPFSSF